MKTTMRAFLILGLLLFLSPLEGHAVSYYLDETNDNNTGTSGPWASVTLTDSTYSDGTNTFDSVHFVVDPIDLNFADIGTNFGLQDFYFNEGTTDGSVLAAGDLPSDWSYSYGSYNAGGGFGKFEFDTNGTGSSRQNPLSFYMYATNGSAVSIADFTSVFSTEGYLFAAHIADYNGGFSAKFATDGVDGNGTIIGDPIPEPATLVLLGIGLVGTAGLARRKKAQQ